MRTSDGLSSKKSKYCTPLRGICAVLAHEIKDGWDRIIYEAVLVSSFLLILAYRRILSEDPSKVSLRVLHVQWALLCLFVAFLLGCVLLFCDTGDHVELFVVLKSILHIVGVGYYQAWLAVPCLDSKKTDLMPHYDTFL